MAPTNSSSEKTVYKQDMKNEEATPCEQSKSAWATAGLVIGIILIIMFLWVTIWAILIISNPTWVRKIIMGDDEPQEDALADLRLASIYSAIITIGIAIILGISFGCTKCWKNTTFM